MLGRWEPTFPVTKIMHNYLKERSWLSKTEEDTESIKYLMKEYCRRKHLVYSTCFCWCPVLWNCNQCLINKHPDNIYYTSYYINFVCCCHGNYMFCTASRSGELFLWNLTYHKKDATKHKLEISFVHESQIEWPFSLAWYQVSPKDSKKTILFVFLLYLLNDELNIHSLMKIPTYNNLIMFQC